MKTWYCHKLWLICRCGSRKEIQFVQGTLYVYCPLPWGPSVYGRFSSISTPLSVPSLSSRLFFCKEHITQLYILETSPLTVQVHTHLLVTYLYHIQLCYTIFLHWERERNTILFYQHDCWTATGTFRSLKEETGRVTRVTLSELQRTAGYLLPWRVVLFFLQRLSCPSDAE